ncbi:EF hand associated-domain-containing protein [Lipomyces chichibuensis]|uniref:EF hand associated-domain-containing protein n=1 Tax=Lipomyces chichibuensis TaxID=1546026 RepID=UPI0033432F2C
MSSDVRLVLCGDEGVGKSSLITSFVKETFVPNIQSVLPPISIPPEFISVANNLTMSIVDTSSRPQDRQSLNREIRRANVILLVYSDHYTSERIPLFWLPYFRSLGVNVPVVLCANKCDLVVDTDSAEVILDEMIPIMEEFKEIESCIRSSAKEQYNVNQAFYLCEKAVIHPIAPLFDSKEQNLKPPAIAALQRIFFLCDKDQDGFLNDKEMNDLQLKCFNKSLNPFDHQEIKSIIYKADVGSATEEGISQEGFIALNKIFALKGRHETTWGILRTFHYTDSLSLSDKFLYPRFDVPQYSSVELSPAGYRFFVDLFLLFDKDNDGGLNSTELNSLFAPTPEIPASWTKSQFPTTTLCNEEGHVTLQGWLAQWSMTTFQDHKTTLAYLAWLGFEGSERGGTTDALKVTKPRRRRKTRPKPGKVDRNVFSCYVLGAPDSGKSAILDRFLNRPFYPLYMPTIKPRIAVNSVEMQGGKQCYMILEELGELEPAVLDNSTKLDECDVICYTYDSSNPDSFQHIVDLRSKYPLLDRLPAVFAALKADLDKQQQRSDQQPDAYTRELGLSAPLHVSATWTSSLSELFVQLAEAAQNPSTATPILEPEEKESPVMPMILASSAVAIVVATVAWMFRTSREP